MRKIARVAVLATLLAAGCASKTSVLFTLRSNIEVTQVVTTVLVDGVEEPRLAGSFDRLTPKSDGELGAIAYVLGERRADVTLRVRALDPDGNPLVASASVTVERGARASATVSLATPTRVMLSLSTSGMGAGEISGAFGTCRGSCVIDVPALIPISLTATPDERNTFSTWSGACAASAQSPQCDLVPSQDEAVDAAFDGLSFAVSVELALGAQGSGIVVSTPARIDCGQSCSARFSAGTEITLTPMLGTDVDHRWLDETCAGQTGPCVFTLDGDRDLRLIAGRYNYAFVSEGLYSSNLSGLSGADDKCRAEAAAANLPGTFVAWLAATGVRGPDRVAGARGWVRADGLPFLDDVSGFVAGAMIPIYKTLYPLRLTAAGIDIREEFNTEVWTGMDQYAGPFGSSITWMAPGVNYRVGSALRGGQFWSSYQLATGQTARLYCLGVDFSRELIPTLPTTPTRVAFLSNNVSKASGISGFDAQCAADALGAGLTGTFVALSATTGEPAAARFDLNGPPWRRPDGVLLAQTASEFLEGGAKHTAPILQRADGTYVNFGTVLTGAAQVTSLAQPQQNCDDWSNASAPDPAFAGDASAASSSYFLAQSTPCTGNGVVYCLEQ